MGFKKNEFTTIVEQASIAVPGFRESYQRFHQKAILEQNSSSFVENYGRSAAHIAIHFGVSPENLDAQQINSYLYYLSINQNYAESYFKCMVFGMRYWFRLFGMEDKALRMPPIKKKDTLPVVLSKEECKKLFAAPRMLKHRFLLAMAYSGGLRMNELRHLKIADIDTDRMQIRIRQGKGNKDRYVILSKVIKNGLEKYYAQYKPQVYVFNGQQQGELMGERSIQYIINEAVQKSGIQKAVSMHTLRHSYATHLLEDGIDLFSIKKLLGHSDIRTTLVYLHVAQIKTHLAHSPLDSLYGRK
jgi:site-specific recombinase XerD